MKSLCFLRGMVLKGRHIPSLVLDMNFYIKKLKDFLKKLNLFLLLVPNPMARKLNNMETESDHPISFHKISRKCMVFIAIALVGILLTIQMQQFGRHLDEIPIFNQLYKDKYEYLFNSTLPCLVAFGLAAFLHIGIPFIAFLFKKKAIVTGGLYCISAGFIYSYCCILGLSKKDDLITALIITITYCLVILLNFIVRGVVITKTFSRIIMSLVGFVHLCGILPKVGTYLPAFSFMTPIFDGHITLKLVCAVFSVGLGGVFLLVVLDILQNVKDRKISDEYEWYCAFSVVFSIIWMFVRILSLIEVINLIISR